jgi:hypothetical protein
MSQVITYLNRDGQMAQATAEPSQIDYLRRDRRLLAVHTDPQGWQRWLGGWRLALLISVAVAATVLAVLVVLTGLWVFHHIGWVLLGLGALMVATDVVYACRF